jgi:nuclear pore complex protein Nup54
MSFTFGTPAPTTNTTFGGFGASQAPATSAFGAQPAAAPATTGFGTSQPATGFGTQPTTGFGGFGATSTATSTPFGGTSTAPTGFGAATTTPSSTGFSFGAASTAPTSTPSFGGFGAASTAPTSAPSFGGFGTTSTAPTSTPAFGGFGATSTAPTSTPSFGGFGATTTSAPASTGLFGAPATSSAGGFGGFGNAAAAKPSFNLGTTTTGGSLFGAKPATTSLFGNTATTGFGQPQNSEALNKQRGLQVYQILSQIEQEERAKSTPSITSEDYKPDNVWHSLALLKSWWDPKSPHCRFKHYFYNVVAPNEVQLYQKPVDHDQKAWDKAQEMNPDRTKMVPALAIGFDDVQKRMDEQHKLSEAHSAKLAELETILKDIQKKSQLDTAVKLEDYKRRHMQTAQRVIKVKMDTVNDKSIYVYIFMM